MLSGRSYFRNPFRRAYYCASVLTVSIGSRAVLFSGGRWRCVLESDVCSIHRPVTCCIPCSVIYSTLYSITCFILCSITRCIPNPILHTFAIHPVVHPWSLRVANEQCTFPSNIQPLAGKAHNRICRSNRSHQKPNQTKVQLRPDPRLRQTRVRNHRHTE